MKIIQDKHDCSLLETALSKDPLPILILTLINIYGPNRDDPDFYQGISNSIIKYNNPVILGGDFNLVIDPDMDLQDYVNVNNPKAREQVLNMMFEHNLLDVWRDLN